MDSTCNPCFFCFLAFCYPLSQSFEASRDSTCIRIEMLLRFFHTMLSKFLLAAPASWTFSTLRICAWFTVRFWQLAPDLETWHYEHIKGNLGMKNQKFRQNLDHSCGCSSLNWFHQQWAWHVVTLPSKIAALQFSFSPRPSPKLTLCTLC